MNVILNESGNTLHPLKYAMETANKLNNDPEDDWSYAVEAVGNGMARINVFDEENIMVGSM